jgi:hypothetical protein
MPGAHKNKNEHKQREEQTAKNLLAPEFHW